MFVFSFFPLLFVMCAFVLLITGFSSFLRQFLLFVVEIEYVSDSKVLNGTSPALYPLPQPTPHS